MLLISAMQVRLWRMECCMIYDVCIIGAGITGAMTARKLAKYDVSVAVIEAAGDVAMGATKANSAIVHAGFDAEEGTLKARLNVAGCAMMPAEAKELDVPFSMCGSLVCAYSDEEILQAMELGEDPRRMNYSVKKDGTISGDLANRDQLKLLESYVFRVLAKMVEEIASGNVDPNPYTRGTSHNACAFCPYGSVCHDRCVEGRRNYKTVKAKDFWEAVGKEMMEHGR